MKLVQKRFLRGRSEFAIVDDMINVRVKSLHREENQAIPLAMLNPEPVVSGDFLEFHGRVRGHHPLLSLMLDKPSAREYNAFVDELKRRAREEYQRFAGLKGSPRPANAEAAAGSVDNAFRRPARPVNSERVDEAIRLLREYLGGEAIEPLLAALEALKSQPESQSSFAQLILAFDELGPQQGAVLTYAPYIGVLLSDDPAAY